MPKPTSTLNTRGDVFCSYCGQGFNRDEHLERHILTHINVRPFRCPECRVAFKRKDLLRRHYQSIHVPPPDDGDPISTRTETVDRIPIACVNCAQSKTKCDKQVPCGRCVKRDLTCERRQFRRSSWKGNPRQDVRPASAGKAPDEKPIREAQEFEMHTETEEPRETGSEISFHPSTSIAMTDMHAPDQADIHESSRSPELLNHGHDAGPEYISGPVAPVADMLGHKTNTYDIGAHIANGLQLSVGIDGSLFPEVQTASYPDTHFDMPMDESYFNDALMDAYLMSASSDKTFSDSEWSLIQDDLQRISHTPAKSLPGGELHSAWPLFHCNPRAGESSTTTTKTNLANLKVLENPAIWSICAPPSSVLLHPPLEETSSPFHASTRDRLLAVTQHIWRMSRERIFSTWSADQQSMEARAWVDKIILLPPTDVLRHFLTRHIYQENQRFHLFPTQELSISESLLHSETKVMPGILTLLMIAQATRSASACEGRDLSNGLVEVCRMVVQDAVDADGEVPVNAEFLETSLCLQQLMQWSGDPWHMTIVLDMWEQHSKIIQKSFLQKDNNGHHIIVPAYHQPSRLGIVPPVCGDAQSRMFYSWLAVDLELSLFHDTPPKLAADTIAVDLPADNFASQTMPVDDWSSTAAMSMGGSLAQFGNSYTSLKALFEAFMECQLSGSQENFSSTSLRLLLHPLQSLSTRLHQCLNTFSSMQSPNTTMGLASKAFMDEVGTLLERWRRLFVSTVAMTGSTCPTLQGSLVLYRVMVLNNLASFPEVERLTRERSSVFTPSNLFQSWMRTASPEALALLLFNCGQCLQNLRTIPPMSRPLWWAGGLYRVALVLSQAVISNNSTSSTATLGFHSSLGGTPSPNSSVVTLDLEYTQHGQDQDIALQRFLGRMQGTPVLTKPDGSAMVLSSETNVLDYCVSMLDEHLVYESSSFASGIRLKLCVLRSRWADGT